MKLVKSDHRTSQEGLSTDDFNPDAAGNLQFEKTARRLGMSKSAQNLPGIFYLE